MAILGPSDLKDLALPALWDLVEMKRVALADSTTFDAVLGDVQAGLSMLNGRLVGEPHYGGSGPYYYNCGTTASCDSQYTYSKQTVTLTEKAWLPFVPADESVKQGVQWVLEREGRLDVVVSNAGYSLSGAVEDTAIEEARDEMETNFLGTIRLCRAALPTMREQGGGYWVNISSIAGLVGVGAAPPRPPRHRRFLCQ